MSGIRFGFCVMHIVNRGIDTGDIVLYGEFIYPPHCRTPSDYERVYLEKNIEFLTKFIAETKSEKRTLQRLPQVEYFSSYYPRLSTIVNSWIDWAVDAHQLERFICAFDSPYQGAQTYLNSRRVFLKSVSLCFEDGLFHPYQFGLIYRKGKKWLCVCINNGSLIVEDILDEEGNDIFQVIRVGDRFITPVQRLEEAKQRIECTPIGKR